MKKIILNFIPIIFCFTCYCQDSLQQGYLKYNVEKKYFHQMPSGKKELYDSRNYSASLYYKGNETLYKEFSGEIVSDNQEKRLSNGALSVIPSNAEKTQMVVYKNYDENKITYSFSPIQGRLGNFLFDTIRNQNWESTNEDKIINNRKCTKFVLDSFYNTRWTAWIDLNVPFTEGPWRFLNLPGLVIELVADNETQKFTLQEMGIGVTISNVSLMPDELKTAKIYNKTEYEKIEKDKKERIRLIMEQNNKHNE